MTPAQAALSRRCGSGATNPPAHAPKPRIVAVPGPPLPPALTPEQLLATCPTQLRVFQLLDDLAAAGGALPTRKEIAIALATSVEAVSAAMSQLQYKELIRTTSTTNMRYAALQICGSGKWLRK